MSKSTSFSIQNLLDFSVRHSNLGQLVRTVVHVNQNRLTVDQKRLVFGGDVPRSGLSHRNVVGADLHRLLIRTHEAGACHLVGEQLRLGVHKNRDTVHLKNNNLIGANLALLVKSFRSFTGIESCTCHVVLEEFTLRVDQDRNALLLHEVGLINLGNVNLVRTNLTGDAVTVNINTRVESDGSNLIREELAFRMHENGHTIDLKSDIVIELRDTHIIGTD